MKEKIDFIITWVDNTDKDWQKSKEKYSIKSNDESNSIIRYRDWEILKYWFRAVEKNADWVNKIYFVTCGHLPKWLDTKNEKIVIVKHEDYIPKEFLPTFNSNVIELFFNRIPNLSEKFVYFNDDVFIVDKVGPEYFFGEKYPKDTLIFNSVSVNSTNTIIEHSVLNDLEILSKYFNKNDVLKNNKGKIYNVKYGKDLLRTLLLRPWKYFTGINNYHTAMPYVKSTWDKIWKLEYNSLYSMGNNKFRTKYDINHWLFKYWQMFEGKFEPTSQKKNKYYDLTNDNNLFFEDLKRKKYKIVCINDANKDLNFDKVKREMVSVFEDMFPNKSKYEK
jgi:hypothetical protein